MLVHHYLKCTVHLVFMWKNSVKKTIWGVAWNYTSNKYGLFAVGIGFKLVSSGCFFFLHENITCFKEPVPCSIANENIEKKKII